MDILRYDPKKGSLISREDYINENLAGLPNEDLLSAQWERLPYRYDSEVDTLRHIKRVNELLLLCCMEFQRRAICHDDSKLRSPEKDRFDEFTPLLRTSTYGTPEYFEMLKGLDIGHHYSNNSHHPEHYVNGIDGMDLFDLVEMFFDWCAASERHDNGDIMDSIGKNESRFSMSEQLVAVFRNTAERHYKKP